MWRLAVALLDDRRELLGLEPVDLPHDLVGVGDRDAEAAVGDLLQLVPVVVEGRVDVDGDAHLDGGSTVERDARFARGQVHRRPAAPGT